MTCKLCDEKRKPKTASCWACHDEDREVVAKVYGPTIDRVRFSCRAHLRLTRSAPGYINELILPAWADAPGVLLGDRGGSDSDLIDFGPSVTAIYRNTGDGEWSGFEGGCWEGNVRTTGDLLHWEARGRTIVPLTAEQVEALS